MAGCERRQHARGLCNAHHRRSIKGASLEIPLRERIPGLPCEVDGCDAKRVGGGLCRTHYNRKHKYGRIELLREKNTQPVVYLDRKGYRCVRIKGREYKEHRLIMEDLLNRPLLRTETVHHCNTVKDDNRTDGPLDAQFRSGNLELWTKSQPSGGRVSDKVAWAVELLELYAPELLARAPVQLRLEV